MIQSLAILLFFVFAALPALAQQTAIPTKPELTVSLEPRHVKTGGAYVQGQIVLRVQLVSPHPFEALQLELPPVAGAQTLTLSPPKTDEIHNYSLKGYVYATKLALFPEQSGVLTIPSIAAAGAIAVGPGQSKSFAETEPEMLVTIKPIDPDYDAPWWLVADAATMTEVWTPPPEELRVGDIVRRDITVTVYGVTAEHLPVIEQTANSGYSVVGSETAARTDLTPNGTVATLRRFWDLRIESEAVFSISPIRLAFWDLAAGAMASASLLAKRIEPLARDADASRAQLMSDAIAAHRNRRISLFAALSVPALALLALIVARLYKSLPTRADRRLSRTCKGNSTPVACFQAVTRWSHDSFGIDGRNTIGRLQHHRTFATDIRRRGRRAARRQRLYAFWRQIMRGITSVILPSSHLPGRIR